MEQMIVDSVTAAAAEPVVVAVEKSHSIADVETLAERIIAASPRCDLLLATTLRNFQFGGSSSLIQALITWSKWNPDGCLLTHIQEPGQVDVQLDNLSAEDHGLVAILRAADVRSRDRRLPLKRRAMDFALQRLSRMRNGAQGAKAGANVLLLCADDTSYAHLPSLYHQDEDRSVKGVADIQKLASDILQATIPYRKAEPFHATIQEYMGVILYELFQNTDEWATKDLRGRRIRNSVRGIESHLHRGYQKALLGIIGESRVLGGYIGHERFSSVKQPRAFLELSIFDSGPGLAQRRLRKSLDSGVTLQEEHQAVLGCLMKWATTSSASHKGIGLHRVLETLTLAGGFLRLRTGRLSLQRDFVKWPYQGAYSGPDPGPEPFLLDWFTESAELSQATCVEGTLLTMILPVRFR